MSTAQNSLGLPFPAACAKENKTYKSEEHTKEVQMQRPRLIEVTLDYWRNFDSSKAPKQNILSLFDAKFGGKSRRVACEAAPARAEVTVSVED